MKKLPPVKEEKSVELGYWAGFAFDVLKSRDALCGLTFLLAIGTIFALALHEYGIDVLPRARAAQIEATEPNP